MKLEDQLETLAKIGLRPNPGVDIDDFLYSFDREEYEKEPFDLVMFVLGMEVEREPFGHFSDVAWNLDMECIEGDGSYAEIVDRLCVIAGVKDSLSGVSDVADADESSGTLSYTINGERRQHRFEINSDWADPDVLAKVMADIERAAPGKAFYAKDNGQASIWFFLNEDQLTRLVALGAELVRGS